MSIQSGTGYTFTASSQGMNLSILTPWAPWMLYGTENKCPFDIEDKSEGTTYKFSAVPGTINSVIPQIGITANPAKRLDVVPAPTTTFNFDPSTHYSYIYLKVGADYSDSPTIYPVTSEFDILYPRIISTSIQQASTDDSSFFLLAVAYQDPDSEPADQITITQLTCGSQWSDRIKLGSNVARYYFARA